MPNKKTNGFKD